MVVREGLSMINTVVRYSALLLMLLALQFLIIDNIQFSGYVNPVVYLLFIILLPFEIEAWIVLPLSFMTGLIVDIFSGTPGMHPSATVAAGFVRPYILAVVAPRDQYDQGVMPGIRGYGLKWFASYVTFMVLVHHFILFYVDVFRFEDFFSTLLRVLLSSLFSVVFIILIQFTIIRR